MNERTSIDHLLPRNNRCHGLGVSAGVVIGRVLRLQEERAKSIERRSEADLERERRRFRAAVRLSRRQLEAIKDRAEKELGRGHAYIRRSSALSRRRKADA